MMTRLSMTLSSQVGVSFDSGQECNVHRAMLSSIELRGWNSAGIIISGLDAYRTFLWQELGHELMVASDPLYYFVCAHSSKTS